MINVEPDGFGSDVVMEIVFADNLGFPSVSDPPIGILAIIKD